MFQHRLLLLAESFPPSIGGIQAYLSGLWGALPSEQSFVVAAPQRGDAAWDARGAYRVVRAPTRAFFYPRWRTFWQAARHLVTGERIEAVVCGKALFEGRAAQRLQREFGLPYVVCTYAMEISAWLEAQKTRHDLHRVLEGAARVLVINDQTKRELRRFGVPERKLVKLYPGVADPFFHVPDGVETFRARHRLSGKRVITSVGRLVPRKGHRVLVAAFPQVLREVPGAHLLIVGDGPERAALARDVEDRGLVGAVTFLGAVPEDDVRRALAVADSFALTPLDDPQNPEGFGIVYLEAAAAGKPSVGTRVGGVPEAVLDGQTGMLVPPSDPAATGAALVRVLTDAGLRQALGAAARARADKEFHWPGRALVFQGMIAAMLTEQPKHQ